MHFGVMKDDDNDDDDDDEDDSDQSINQHEFFISINTTHDQTVNKTINNMMLTGQLTEERDKLSVNVNLPKYWDT